MKIVEDLKKKVADAQTKEEAKEIIRDTIEETDVILNDEELDNVSGGIGGFYPAPGRLM